MNPLAFNYTGSPNGGGTDLAKEGDRVVVEDRQEEEVGVQVLAVVEGLVHRLSTQIKLAGLELSLGSKVGNSQGLAGATEAAGLAGVSATQLQQLFDFLNLAKTKDRLYGKNSNFSWIIDTGASNHMTCDLSFLRKVKHCPVGLPDGNTAEANQEGSVVLPGGLC
ncbi:hypothetical protein ACOSQ4_017406 [Xanthoceras sorbifolium]